MDKLDDLVALVHRLLDQRVTAQRADHVQTGYVTLILAVDLRYGIEMRVADLDATALDELARWNRSQARDYAVTVNARFTGRRLQQNRTLAILARQFEARDVALIHARQGDIGIVDCRQDGTEVALLGTAEFSPAVDDRDAVIPRQRNRILDRRVASAHHDDGLTAIRIRIIQRVQDKIGFGVAVHTQRAWITLCANGQHHVLSAHLVTAGEMQEEVAL